jgi:hypothetical protein
MVAVACPAAFMAVTLSAINGISLLMESSWTRFTSPILFLCMYLINWLIVIIWLL